MQAKKAIQIIGAGPGGLSAAISLAKRGREVHVHERYECAGKRFRGDLQGLENWTEQEDVLDQIRSQDIEINFETTPFYEVTVTDGKNTFRNASKKPLFYLVKRGPFSGALDSGLEKQALASGVKIHYQSTLLTSEADIIATGPIRKSVIAADKGFIFKSDLPNLAVAIFHDDLAFQGYSYLLVAQGYGCLCTVVFQDLHRLNTCFEKTISLVKNLYPIDLQNARPVGGIGSFCFNHHKQEKVLVGEAAGFQDLLWGFGIRTALTSGYLAAQSIHSNKNYEELVSKKLVPFLKASIVNRYLWEKCKFVAKPLLPYVMKIPISLEKQFKFLYRFSMFHRILYPIALKYVQKHYINSIANSDAKNFSNHSDQK